MKNDEMEAAVFRIYLSDAGWTVLETFCRRPITEFADRDDALEYAIWLAQNQPRAVVEIYGKGGLLEARGEYTAPTDAAGRRRACSSI